MNVIDTSFCYRHFLIILFLFANCLLKGCPPQWTSINAEFPEGFHVTALTANPEQKLLYIAGTYNDTIYYVKEWNGSVWRNIGDPLNGAPNALELFDSTLYAGGEFTGTIDRPESLHHIAHYDLSDNKWLQAGAGLDNTVLALCANGKKLYIGGAFKKTYDGADKLNAITAWDGVKFNQLGTPGAPGLGGTDAGGSFVKALLILDDCLYVGGTFTRDMTGTVLNRIAKLDMAKNIFLPLGRGIENGCVNVIVFNGSKIIAGGSFNEVNQTESSNGNFHAGYIAQWDGENWTNLGDFNNSVESLVTNESKLYAAGMFTKNGRTPIDHIAVYDCEFPAKAWQPLSSADIGLTAREGPVIVNALGKWENTLFACGNFDASHTVPDLNGIAVWTDTICVNCLYCEFTPEFVIERMSDQTASCRVLAIIPSYPEQFGVRRRYFAQLKPVTKTPLSWEGMPELEVLHDSLLLTNLNSGEDYGFRVYSECIFPMTSIPKSYSRPTRGYAVSTRTVRAARIKKTSAEILVGLEATINPVSVIVCYRKSGESSWESRTTEKVAHPTIFKIKGLLSNTTYEFKAGFVFMRYHADGVIAPEKIMEDCAYTFKTQ